LPLRFFAFGCLLNRCCWIFVAGSLLLDLCCESLLLRLKIGVREERSDVALVDVKLVTELGAVDVALVKIVACIPSKSQACLPLRISDVAAALVLI
jgi:hypothetical protein